MKIHTNPPTPKKTESTPLEHLDGLPPYLMMKIEQRLIVRIGDAIRECEIVGEENQFIGYRWRSLWAMRSDELAKDILGRMMAQRMRDGKQFDSVLAASKRYFAQNLLPQLLKEMESAK